MFESDPSKKGDMTRVWDMARNSIVADNMQALVTALHRLIALHRAGVIRIVRLKDRFADPTDGGWADLALNSITWRPPPKGLQ